MSVLKLFDTCTAGVDDALDDKRHNNRKVTKALCDRAHKRKSLLHLVDDVACEERAIK